jgi:DNA-binding transcriptional LysR family regulator
MDSNRLIQFKAIAELESLTKASEKLFISQPALSKSLSNLEEELGCKLFNRVGRRLFINSEGRKLLKYANHLEDILKQIKDDFKRKPDRTLSICGVGNFFYIFLKKYFKDGIKPIKFDIVPSASIPELLLSGDVDMAFADDMYLKAVSSGDLVRMSILQEQLFLSVPINHPLAAQKVVDITDLDGLKITRSTASSGLNDWIGKILEMNNISVDWSVAVDLDTWRDWLYSSKTNMPVYFDSSSSYMTSNELGQELGGRSLITVKGTYTSRMIFLWYFEQNRGFLNDFLKCVMAVYRPRPGF